MSPPAASLTGPGLEPPPCPRRRQLPPPPVYSCSRSGPEPPRRLPGPDPVPHRPSRPWPGPPLPAASPAPDPAPRRLPSPNWSRSFTRSPPPPMYSSRQGLAPAQGCTKCCDG
ncbi:hypothetical protein BS78_06G063400 [Paspalum vaginatum]|nr:hypothetical protein BS78_06G063400 [Paspalum vaginatum]